MNIKLEKEQRIIHRLLMTSNICKDIGLFHGKAGIMLFFMHYYQYTNKILFENVALDLLDEITNNLSKSLSIDFESGLCGIAWAINYLIERKRVEGDSLEICEDIDNKIMETDPCRLNDYSLKNGLGGILLYVLSHIKLVYKQRQTYPFDSDYMHDLYIACSKIRYNKTLSPIVRNLLESYIAFYMTKTLPDNRVWDLSVVIEDILYFNEKKISSYPLGLCQGLSGFLYKNLSL